MSFEYTIHCMLTCMYMFLNTSTVTSTYMCRFMQINMYNFIMVFSDLRSVVYAWCAFQNTTLCTLYAHKLTCTCTVVEPNVEPKKKKDRISDDDGEESEHSVQGTVTKLHVNA